MNPQLNPLVHKNPMASSKAPKSFSPLKPLESAPAFGATFITHDKITISPAVNSFNKGHGDIFFIEHDDLRHAPGKADAHSAALKKLEDEISEQLKNTTVLEGSLVRGWLAQGRNILFRELSLRPNNHPQSWIDQWILRLEAANMASKEEGNIDRLLKEYQAFKVDSIPTLALSPAKEALRTSAFQMLADSKNLLGESNRKEGWSLNYTHQREDTMNGYELRFDTLV